ncbi:MAG: sigma-70 family RNA polymerase sigma factor [Verrucomicrobiota bacterium]|nr:sigma-70 family RNA polymerase sigma factor [Verrucomicrobiota bacterium]
MPGTTDEKQLVQKCLMGEPFAWNQLFDLFYQPTARFVFQVSASFNKEDVEEICQETFLNVVHNLSSFRGQSGIQTWIFRIASNKAHDFIARRSTLKRGSGLISSLNETHPDGQEKYQPESNEKSPDQVVIAGEQKQELSLALEKLGPPCQEVIELRYFGDLSYEEIGRALKLNVKTVSSRLSKCLNKLEQTFIQISGSKAEGMPSNV